VAVEGSEKEGRRKSKSREEGIGEVYQHVSDQMLISEVTLQSILAPA
jgi:hypothetical protein